VRGSKVREGSSSPGELRRKNLSTINDDDHDDDDDGSRMVMGVEVEVEVEDDEDEERLLTAEWSSVMEPPNQNQRPSRPEKVVLGVVMCVLNKKKGV
jgi:hypothetical protein